MHGESQRRRVFVPQALGSEEYLRVTWHESRQVMVFSHWNGDRCVAATPVLVADIDDLAVLVTAAHESLAEAWAPPAAETLVVPAAGLAVPTVARRYA